MWAHLKGHCYLLPLSDQGRLGPGDQPIFIFMGAKVPSFLSNNQHHSSLEGGKKVKKSQRDLSDIYPNLSHFTDKQTNIDRSNLLF